MYGVDKMYSERLQHHGIKGQKWGVKNGPPYPLKISRSESRKMNKKGYTLEKGTYLYRTTGNAHEGNKGSTFASFSENDKNFYNQRLCVNMLNPKADAFNMTMKLKEDLVVPSQKERVDSFVKYMSTGDNAKRFNAYLKDVFSDDLHLYMKASKDINKKNFMGYLTFCVSTSGVNRTTAKSQKLAKTSEDIRNEYYSILKRKGYNATVDDLDAVDTIVSSNNPVIVFNRENTVDVIEVKKIDRGW